MSDLAERLLEAIAVEEEGADSASRSKYVRHRPGGTYKEFRPRDEERYQAILRRCAADRKILNLHKAFQSPHGVECEMCVAPQEYPCETVRWLARGYGLEVDSP